MSTHRLANTLCTDDDKRTQHCTLVRSAKNDTIIRKCVYASLN